MIIEHALESQEEMKLSLAIILSVPDKLRNIFNLDGSACQEIHTTWHDYMDMTLQNIKALSIERYSRKRMLYIC